MYFVNFANRFTRHNLSHRGLFAWRERESFKKQDRTRISAIEREKSSNPAEAMEYILCTSNPSTVLHAKRKCSRVKYY